MFRFGRNIRILVVLSYIGLAGAQTPSWKEYVFADDGFAITVPASPREHADPDNPEFTVYSLPPPDKAILNLRVSHQNRDCASMLAQLKEGALRGESGILPSSVRTPSLGGSPGLEYEWTGPVHTSSDRFYCVSGKFYAFSASWPRGTDRPSVIIRAISSFRLLGSETKK